MVVAVVATILTSLAVFFVSSVDVLRVLQSVLGYANPEVSGDDRMVMRGLIMTGIVKAIDGYLLATIMLIFGIGLYELFIRQIKALDGIGLPREVLRVRTLDQLKDKLGRVVLLVFVVKFLQVTLELQYKSPLDLLYLAIGILLIAGALLITSNKKDSDLGILPLGKESLGGAQLGEPSVNEEKPPV